MKKKKAKRIHEERQHAEKYMYAAAFIIPFVIMGIAFAKLEIYPFGDQQVLVYDAWHQYYPFLAELHRKIRGGESLLYCWRMGMGNGFISLIAYYLASPVNILLILFPASMLKEVFALFILIKIGLSGLLCNYCLNRISNQENHSAYGSIIFSTLYALCSWMVGYYWNIMWLDTFAVFPLVVLGIYLLVKEKKYKLYTIALTVAIFTNYYIGFMVCIFTAIYFFVQCIINKNSIKELLLNLRNIIIFSLISIMISAIVIIPTLITLQNVYKSDYVPGTWELARGWLESLSNTFAYVNATYYGGLPNLYCGVICIVFLFAFYRLKNVLLREKIIYSILIVFFYVSTNIKMLDYAWHGFHFTNSLPYRFTFMLSFVLIMLAYKVYCNMETLNKMDFLIMCVLSAVYFVVTAVDKLSRYAKENNLGSLFEALQAENADIRPLLFKNLLLITAYLVIVFLFINRKLSKKIFTLCLAAVVVVELVPTVFSGTEAVRKTDRNSYPDKYDEVQEILADIDQKEADNSFYRMELSKYYNLNAPLLYGFYGLDTFTSTARSAVTDIFENMGLMAWQAGNRYYYQNSTPVNNTFLNLKYLISRDSELINKEYLKEVKKTENVYAYENQAYLPIGFMVENSMADFHFEGSTPFDKQNDLVKAATGMSEDVFEELDIIHVAHENVEVLRTAYGCYNYKQSAENDPSAQEVFKYNYEMPSDGCAYVYVELSESKTASIEFDGKEESYDITRPAIFPAGTYKKGDIFSVKSRVDAGKSGNLNVFVSVLNQEVFDRAYNMLKDETLDVTKFTSRSLKGTITANKDGLMYTSVPYEEGWKVYVDGKKSEISLIDDAFIAVPLSSGEHTVELKYSPAHVYLSALLSLFGIAVLIGISAVEKRKAHK